jgi:hypothetical protein
VQDRKPQTKARREDRLANPSTNARERDLGSATSPAAGIASGWLERPARPNNSRSQATDTAELQRRSPRQCALGTDMNAEDREARDPAGPGVRATGSALRVVHPRYAAAPAPGRSFIRRFRLVPLSVYLPSSQLGVMVEADFLSLKCYLGLCFRHLVPV